MGFTYTKLFSGLTESTVWVEPYATRVLWVSMLSWADQHGRVFGAVPGIARRAGINIDECEAALVSFSSPDRHSRTPDHDGRRIEKIDGGWRLLNYTKYRDMRDAEARREYQRNWDRENRPTRLRNPTKPDNSDKPDAFPTKAEAEEEVKPNPSRASRSASNGFDAFWQSYPRKKAKHAALKAWKRINPNEQLHADILSAVERAKTSDDWLRDQGRYIPHPATWLNDGCWEDEVAVHADGPRLAI